MLADGQGRNYRFASVAASSLGDNQIVAAATGKKIKVTSYVLVGGGATTAKWRSATTDVSGGMGLVAGSTVSAVGQPVAHLLETAAGQALNLNLSAAAAVGGHVAYVLEA